MSKVIVSEVREPTELEIITKYMTNIEYELGFKDNIWYLKCILEKQLYSVNPEFKWSWKVVFITTTWLEETDILLYQTDEPQILERCINLMNEFIKNNFKTKLW